MGQKHISPGASLWGALCVLYWDVVQHRRKRDRRSRVALLRPAVRVFPGNAQLLIALIYFTGRQAALKLCKKSSNDYLIINYVSPNS